MVDSEAKISKQAEERRQEILDTAMHVFTQKGYEQTTIRDIAKEMNVVPGLCYRYFESKLALYRAAVTEYANDYCAPIIQIFDSDETDIDALFCTLSEHLFQISRNEKYHEFFHKPENKNFNIMLNHKICEILAPHFSNMLQRMAEAQKATVPHSEAYARFLLFGLASVMCDDTMTASQRIVLASEIAKKLFTTEGR